MFEPSDRSSSTPVRSIQSVQRVLTPHTGVHAPVHHQKLVRELRMKQHHFSADAQNRRVETDAGLDANEQQVQRSGIDRRIRS